MRLTQNRNYLLFILLFLSGFVQCLIAQENNPLLDSRDVLQKAGKSYEAGNFKACAEQCVLITPNDSNYYEALHTQISAYLASNDDSLAIILAREGLSHKTSYESRYYNQLGVALIASNKNQEAVTLFQEALKKYPYQDLLYYNLAVALHKLKRTDEAVASLQQSILMNPYNAKSHLKLGVIYLEQNKIIPGILAMEMYLIIEPEASNSKDLILLLEKVVKGENETGLNSGTSSGTASGQDDFSEVEEILKSKIALNKRYKSQTKLNYDLVKQLQVLFEKLKYDKNDKGFVMQNYVPFYCELFSKDHFEAFVYYMMTSVADEEMAHWLKSKKSKVEAFTNWANLFLKEKRSKRPVVLNGEKVTASCWYYSNNSLEAIGNENEKKKLQGYWQLYFPNGNPEAEGMYENGEKSGEWKWYYDQGGIKERSHFLNGRRNGTAEVFMENGTTSSKGNYSDDKLEGEYKNFFMSGDPEISLNFKSGKKEGNALYFYQNGAKRYEFSYKDNEIDGTFKEYYLNGKPAMTCTYVNGKKTGPYISYFRNGKTETEGADKDNVPTGQWNYYYETGQLQKSGIFANSGEPKGLWKFYHENGKPSEEKTFTDNGNISGKLEFHDVDGKLSYVQEYKNGNCIAFQNFDNNGKMVSEAKAKDKKLYMSYAFFNGNTETEGLLEEGKKTGLWKFYLPCRKLSRTEGFTADVLNGFTTEYFPNDSVENKVNFTNGEKEGYYRSWYKNGKPFCEGWYKNDKQAGYWYFYNEKGILTNTEYYNFGELNGWQQHYLPGGKKYYGTYLENDVMLRGMNYDSAGKPVHPVELNNGTGTFTFLLYPDGKPRSVKTFVNGYAFGKNTLLYPNGKPELEGNFAMDKKDGVWTEYRDDGKMRVTEIYENGKLNGPVKKYFPDGTLSYEGNYVSGKASGKCTYYYENKSPELEFNFVNGLLQGNTTLFNPDGQVLYVRKFKEDILVSYSYMNKDGNPVSDIPVQNETAKMVAYYPNGNKSIEKELKNGEAAGIVTQYFANGKVMETGRFESGNKEGIHKIYYANGQLKSEENFYYDKKDGTSVYYYDNGKTERIENYYLGERHGIQTWYDKFGKATKTQNYFYGIQYPIN